MKIILALDDDNGMMFNHRRQSQDIALREKIAEMTEGNKLWLNSYSERQFRDMEIDLCADDDFLDKAGDEEYCFVENVGISPIMEKVEEFILFRWNRRYPSDFQLDILPQDIGFRCIRSEEFPGHSHDKITMEVWRREE